ncbi:S1C family serine protease [Metallococcus carri]|uniref:S1C family serine protease n=1 Tax=Metallococcus carri TaxID=1656884 RepID=UPI001F182C30|nr:trypsin-like peptidase domain-containing protein [Metallococcus carri]
MSDSDRPAQPDRDRGPERTEPIARPGDTGSIPRQGDTGVIPTQGDPGVHSQQPYGGQPGQRYGEGAPQPAYGQRFGQQHGQPQQPAYGSPWAAPSGQAQQGAPPQHGGQALSSAPAQTKQRRGPGWVALPVTALLAALLASGGTYAATRDDGGSSSVTNQTNVVTANPADFADAGTVNWSATANKVTPSVVAIAVDGSSGTASGEAQGSGVILDKQGNIATNNHVVAAMKNAKITVTLANNLSYTAKIVGTDPGTDLAVIRLEKPPADLTPVALGSDEKLVVGQPVMAVGNPLGFAGTVTTGIVSALNRPVTTQGQGSGGGAGEQSSTTNAIQTSAAINPGNSGGALVDGSGRLIGINSAIATLGQSTGSSQSGNIGIGFAIPVSVVQSITGQLIKSGKVQHALLGVQVSDGTAKIGDATEAAAIVRTVNPGSGAAQAGVKVGDAVVAADNRPVINADALVGYVRAKTAGDSVVLTVIRDGKRTNLTVQLGKANS